MRHRLCSLFFLALLASAACAAGPMHVYITLADGTRLVAETTLDTKGHFSVGPLPPGKYAVTLDRTPMKYVFAGTNEQPIEVLAPGDPNAAVKRHKTVTFTKTWGPGTPHLKLVVHDRTITGVVSGLARGHR